MTQPDPAASAPSPSPAPYVERLGPPWWMDLAGALVGASAGLAALRVVGAAGAGVVAALGAVLALWALHRTTAEVRVSGGRLRAGRAVLPLSVVADVEVLDAERTAYLRGPGIDARAYLCQRGWLPLAVRVDLDDPDDPTPYWLVSSRRPDALRRALVAHGAGRR